MQLAEIAVFFQRNLEIFDLTAELSFAFVFVKKKRNLTTRLPGQGRNAVQVAVAAKVSVQNSYETFIHRTG